MTPLANLQRTATSTDMVLIFYQDGTAQAWYYRANLFMPRVPLLFSPEHFHTFGIAVACALENTPPTLTKTHESNNNIVS